MGFQPQDTGTIELRFGFLKLDLTYGPVFATANTVKRCLLIISVWIVCFLTLNSRIFASGFRNQVPSNSQGAVCVGDNILMWIHQIKC